MPNKIKEFILSFFPKGPIFTEENKGFKAILAYLCKFICKYTDIRSLVLKEFDPETAIETLDDWEKSVQLKSEGSIEERQKKVALKIKERGSLSIKYLKKRASIYGYEVNINEFHASRLKHVVPETMGTYKDVGLSLPRTLTRIDSEFYLYVDIISKKNSSERFNRNMNLFKELKPYIPGHVTLVYRHLKKGKWEVICNSNQI